MVGDVNGNKDFSVIKPFAFWTQHVLPLVYGDEISYMETLDKVVKLLNELIKNNNKLPEYIQQIIEEYITGDSLEEVLRSILADFILNVKYPPSDITPAKGDGTTNDFEAIQGCIDYASENGGGVVLFPYGKYLTNSITIKNNVTLLGCGMYETLLVLAGGANKPLLSGNADKVQLCNIGFDCNSESQVNDINNVVLIGAEYSLNNVFFKGGVKSLTVQSMGGNLYLSNILFDSAINESCIIDGNAIVTASNLIFKSISEVSGQDLLYVTTDNGIYNGISCYAKVPIAVQCHGNNNTFQIQVENAVTVYNDEHNSNSWDVIGISKEERYNNSYNVYSENILLDAVEEVNTDAKSITNTAEKISLESETLELNCTNPAIYLTPTNFNEVFKSIPFLDKLGTEYKVLVDNNFNIISNVSSFGADNTGNEDSTNAVNAMLDKYNIAIFYPGTYLVNNLKIRSNMCLIGIGDVTLITDKTGLDEGIIVSENLDTVSNIIIQNLKFTFKTHEFTEDTRAIRLNNVQNVIINRCHFILWNGDAILIDSHLADNKTMNIAINECTFLNDNNARQAISIVGGKRIYIFDNIFESTTQKDMPGAIDLEPYENKTETIEDIYIYNNKCKNNIRPFISIYNNSTIYNNGFKNIYIFNNIVDNPTIGESVNNGLLLFNRKGGISNDYIIVENNIIKAYNYGLCVNKCGYMLIKNNIFENCCMDCSYTFPYGDNEASNELIINGNTFNATKKIVNSFCIAITVKSSSIYSILNNLFNIIDKDVYGAIVLDGDNATISIPIYNNTYAMLNDSNFGYLVSADKNISLKGNCAPESINILFNKGYITFASIREPYILIRKGESFQFNIDSIGNKPFEYTWTITTDGVNPDTTITDGLLNVSPTETVNTITIKAEDNGTNALKLYCTAVVQN